jgi:hypothetical protein
MKPLNVLKNYFNTTGDPEGYVKRPLGEFVVELKALSSEEKHELATLAAAEMGVELEEAA